MGAMDDVFGEHPLRPDTPDFWRLSEINLEMDGAIEAAPDPDKGAAFLALISAHVDLDSVAYVAAQRAYRVLGVRTRGDLVRDARKARQATQLAAMFLDGFIAGCKFTERGGRT